MNVVKCPIAGSYLVRDERQPIPLGKTTSDVSVAVHCHTFGWLCDACGFSGDTTRPECEHVRAAQEVSDERVE